VKDRKAGSAVELLSVSLLSDGIRDVLMTSVDAPSAIAGIERVFTSYAMEFQGLEDIYRDEGLRGIERDITNTFLSVAIAYPLHPLIRTFFARVIDSRNIMSLFKYTRMDFSSRPEFLKGGSVSAARFHDIIDREDPSVATSLVREVCGIRLERDDPARIEIALYTWITRFLKKAGRDPLGVGVILDYLWRRSIEAMNLGVLYHGKDLERDAVIAAMAS
jgi:hypothetical protein